MRLADYKGLSQKEAAKSMRISQQTFSRILRKAHSLIAKGITTGSAIRIQGGQYIISTRQDQQKPAEQKEEPQQKPQPES